MVPQPKGPDSSDKADVQEILADQRGLQESPADQLKEINNSLTDQDDHPECSIVQPDDQKGSNHTGQNIMANDYECHVKHAQDTAETDVGDYGKQTNQFRILEPDDEHNNHAYVAHRGLPRYDGIYTTGKVQGKTLKGVKKSHSP